MLAAFVYFLFPLFWLFVASTKASTDLFSTFGLWFADDFHFFQNIRDLFAARDLAGGSYLLWIRNTALYSITSAVIAALFATAAGYGFARFSFRGREPLFWLVLGAVMVPTQALATPTYLLFAEIGLTNNPLSIILPCSVSPFGVYLMRVYAERAIPTELIEAARLDGAGELTIFRSVAFRLLVPGFVTVAIFAFVATWNNYFLPLIMLSEPKWYPLTVGIRGLGDAGILIGSLLAVAPMILAFVLLQRYWQSGLTAGSVK
ncbi:MAG TPA: carbohydrate ABC transporter permease [Solirubrobacteraceae bacterium]|nr:carbohydrate ABC transporter permease [Solirubrobacteraceae bacterium]